MHAKTIGTHLYSIILHAHITLTLQTHSPSTNCSVIIAHYNTPSLTRAGVDQTTNNFIETPRGYLFGVCDWWQFCNGWHAIGGSCFCCFKKVKTQWVTIKSKSELHLSWLAVRAPLVTNDQRPLTRSRYDNQRYFRWPAPNPPPSPPPHLFVLSFWLDCICFKFVFPFKFTFAFCTGATTS